MTWCHPPYKQFSCVIFVALNTFIIIIVLVPAGSDGSGTGSAAEVTIGNDSFTSISPFGSSCSAREAAMAAANWSSSLNNDVDTCCWWLFVSEWRMLALSLFCASLGLTFCFQQIDLENVNEILIRMNHYPYKDIFIRIHGHTIHRYKYARARLKDPANRVWHFWDKFDAANMFLKYGWTMCHHNKSFNPRRHFASQFVLPDNKHTMFVFYRYIDVGYHIRVIYVSYTDNYPDSLLYIITNTYMV